MTRCRSVLVIIALLLLGAAGALLLVISHGVSARDEATFLEVFLARQMRRFAIPSSMRTRPNAAAPTAEALTRARAHFADHCAVCHGNDGRGNTTLGLNMYPKAPDMTLPLTQRLSDGELFAIIENGVRLTGMPGWGSAGPEDDLETWELVLFIRRLPTITAEELELMKALNPKTRKEREEEETIRRFLDEGASPPSSKEHEH